MIAQVIKCPNCGNNINISSPMRMTVCDYCGASILLEKEIGREEKESLSADQNIHSVVGNPKDIIYVPNEVGRTQVFANSLNLDQGIKILSGISYLTNSIFAIEGNANYTEIREEVRQQTFGLFGKIKTGATTTNTVRYENSIDRNYFVNTLGNEKIVDDSEKEGNFGGEGYGSKLPDNQYRVWHTIRYKGKITPSDIQRFPTVEKIVKNSRSNAYLSKMLLSIKENIINTNCTGFEVEAHEDDYVYVGKAFYFTSFGLQPAKDRDHKCGILSIVASDIMEYMSDRMSLASVTESSVKFQGKVKRQTSQICPMAFTRLLYQS